MTGPEYASAWIKTVKDAGVDCLTDATVTEIRRQRPSEPDSAIPSEMCQKLSSVEAGQDSGGFILTVSSLSRGIEEYLCSFVILASGCRERSRGQLRIPGSRPAASIRPGQSST